MAFLRIKKVKGLQYFYLVENKRDFDGATRQQIIEYLGAPVVALKKAEELKLPQRMIEKIRAAIPEKELYMIVKVMPNGNFSATPRFPKLTQEEYSQIIEKCEE